MCFSWKGGIFFDVVSPQGLRSAPYFAQRTSNAIRHVHTTNQYFLFNYIDDFIGCERKQHIEASYELFIRLLRDLGVKESVAKRVSPTRRLNCVGTMVDAEKNRLEVLPDRQIELLNELETWSHREYCTQKDIQRLVGKLQFICSVVRPGRLFMSRMLKLLRQVGKRDKVKIGLEFVKDITWWLKFLPMFNGTGIMWMYHIKQPDKIVTLDTCLEAMGAICGKEFIKCKFPKKWRGTNIAYLELMAVIVTCKTWSKKTDQEVCCYKM